MKILKPNDTKMVAGGTSWQSIMESIRFRDQMDLINQYRPKSTTYHPILFNH